MNPLSSRIRRVALSYLLAFAVWLALALMLAYQMYLVAIEYNPQALFSNVLLLPITRFFCFALLTPPVFYIVRRYPISAGRVFPRTALYLLGTLGFILSYSFLRLMVWPPWVISQKQWAPRNWESFLGVVIGTFSDQITMYFAIVAVAHAYELYERARRQELEKSELQEALAASELQMLKMQLHPHFLFNTLNGISTLIETDSASAKIMLVKLSNLLRVALQHGSSDLISLRDEVNFVSAYLDLEKMRLGNRLETKLNIDPEISDLLVPQLVLQPLIENAIVHGISCTRGPGWIAIDGRRTERGLELHVRNSVGGRSPRGTGVGLNNTRARLRYLYGIEAKLMFSIQEGSVADALLLLPTLGDQQPAAPRVRVQDSVYEVPQS